MAKFTWSFLRIHQASGFLNPRRTGNIEVKRYLNSQIAPFAKVDKSIHEYGRLVVHL